MINLWRSRIWRSRMKYFIIVTSAMHILSFTDVIIFQIKILPSRRHDQAEGRDKHGHWHPRLTPPRRPVEASRHPFTVFFMNLCWFIGLNKLCRNYIHCRSRLLYQPTRNVFPPLADRSLKHMFHHRLTRHLYLTTVDKRINRSISLVVSVYIHQFTLSVARGGANELTSCGETGRPDFVTQTMVYLP